MLFVSHILHLAEQREGGKPEKMSTVGSIDLETENIRNLKLFLQLHFAFRNINTSKYMIVPFIRSSRVFPGMVIFFFFFFHKKELCINLAQNKVDLCLS